MIDEMLVLINKYGLSHVCGNQIFDNLEKTNIANNGRGEPFNFPYLDTYLSLNWSTWDYNVEFYARGQKDHEINYKNIFEYLLSTTSHGQELNFFTFYVFVIFSRTFWLYSQVEILNKKFFLKNQAYKIFWYEVTSFQFSFEEQKEISFSAWARFLASEKVKFLMTSNSFMSWLFQILILLIEVTTLSKEKVC